MEQYKHCTGCGTIYSQTSFESMIKDPVKSELGANLSCRDNCFYCGTPLTDGMLTSEENNNLDPECVKMRDEKIELIRARRKELEQARKQAREEEERFIQRNGYKCPNCGQYGGQKISTTSRIVGLATLGVLSSNVGKTYKCKHCGYKW